MSDWIKRKIRGWLEIHHMAHEIEVMKKLHSDLVAIGVDAHFKEESMIIIFSHLNGGQVRHIPARFDNIRDLGRFVEHLKCTFRTDRVFVDAPHDLRGFFR